MRAITYLNDSELRAGVVHGADVYDLGETLDRAGLTTPRTATMRSFLDTHGHHLAEVSRNVDSVITNGLEAVGRLSELKLAAPVHDPEKVLCIGLNYGDHVAETGRAFPNYPDVFVKFPHTLIGPNEPIGGLKYTDRLDFEGELAIVIGRRAKEVAAVDALDYVAGAMVLNDVTARDLQYRGTQWLMGKSVDASTPCGPALVTLDEIDDLQKLDVSTLVNGVEMQHSNTKHMIFPVARIIEYVSRTVTLEPGDIIATGTPDGIGAKRNPPVYLKKGDEVVINVEQVGKLHSLVG